MHLQDEKVFNKDAYVGALIIPVCMGANRMRSKAEGAMVEDDGLQDGPLARLRKVLAEEGKLAGVDADAAYVTMCVGQVLRLYEESHRRFMAERQGELGHVYEGMLPSGRIVLMAPSQVLERIGLRH